jgi:hypothetical protein
MRRLWQAPGVMVMLTGFTIILTRSAQNDGGITSSGFLWSAAICGVVGAVALTARFYRERRS